MAAKKQDTPKDPAKTFLDRLSEIERKQDIILSALQIITRDVNNFYTTVDDLKATVSGLSQEAQNVVNFYAQMKKLEQEIFWNHIKNS